MKTHGVNPNQSTGSDFDNSSFESNDSQVNPGNENEENHFLILRSDDNNDLGEAIKRWESSRYMI